MLPQSHVSAIKIQTFLKLVETLAFTLSAAYVPVAQQLDKIHVLVHMRASFVDPLRESVSWSKFATGVRLKACFCTSEMCKYKNRNHNDGHDDSLLNCNIDSKKHTADLALTASRFSQTRWQESFSRKW